MDILGVMLFMLNEISAFGSPFSHDVTSCYNVLPKNFKWVFNKPSNIEIYMDYNILGGYNSKSKNKFLWLAESKEIVSNQFNYIKDNYTELKKIYKKIFTNIADLIVLDECFEYCPPASNKSWIVDGKIYNKSKIASMICSGVNETSGHKYRNNLMNFYKEKNVPIDFYGRSHNPFNKKEEALADYCFSFVVENGQYSDYYTEKIMDCFATGTIPIYYGSPEIYKNFNMNGILLLDNSFNYDILSFELYQSKLDAIHDNFIKEKNHKIADDVLFEKLQKYI